MVIRSWALYSESLRRRGLMMMGDPETAATQQPSDDEAQSAGTPDSSDTTEENGTTEESAATTVTGARPTGRLLHAAVSLTPNMVAADAGWPVPQFPARNLAGARIGHGQSNIVFGITSRVPGINYSVAGLKIRYRYRGQVYSVIAWSAASPASRKL